MRTGQILAVFEMRKTGRSLVDVWRTKMEEPNETDGSHLWWRISGGPWRSRLFWTEEIGDVEYDTMSRAKDYEKIFKARGRAGWRTIENASRQNGYNPVIGGFNVT
jgi:hypothetical protein